MSLKNKVSFGLFVLLTSACAKSGNLTSDQQRSSAPQSAKDVGVLVEGATPQQVSALLEAHPGAKVRVLNQTHGLYELYGIELRQVQSEYQGVSEANQFFTKQTQKHAELLSTAAPVGLQLGDLQPCQARDSSPTAVLSVDSPAIVDGATIDIGPTIKINGAQSQPSAASPAPLKMDFVIAGPESSAKPEQIVQGLTATFTPDTLGAYQVYLVVQDGSNACSVDHISFIVTAHRPYTGPSTAPPLNLDLSKFAHLGMIDAPNAWKLSEGSGVVIAIVDSGVDYNHPSISPQMLINRGEIPSNGIDDDKNGFIDDYVGYDFANQNAWPYDDDSHGTHVAGLAAGQQFGVARKAKILAVKAMSPVGGDIGTISAAIRYAVDRGANIVNLSLGATVPFSPQVLTNAIAYAASKKVLVVVAAGNGDPQTGLGYSIDDSPVFPASLHAPNMVNVAAFDATDVISTYSNFGPLSVDVVGPGGSQADPMISAAFENPKNALFIGMSGTSMATPVVSGIAAMVMSRSPGLSLAQVRAALISAGTDEAPLKGITISGKHINALSALLKAAE